MKKKVLALILSLLLVFTTIVGLAGCKKQYTGGDTLVVGYSYFSQKFSAFYAKTAYDQDVATMTGITLLGNTRGGNMVLTGINGQKESYNGTEYTYYGPADCVIEIGATNADGKRPTTYTFTMRDDIKFSDGTPVTIDDVIFSIYVVCDPTYIGSSTLYSQPILGMTEYRTGVNSTIATKYNALADEIWAAGMDNTDFSNWTQAQQESYFGECMEAAGISFTQEIIDYVNSNYTSYIEDRMGDITEAQVAGSDGLKVAFGMRMWGFGSIEGTTFTDATGNVYELGEGQYPTVKNYWDCIVESYGGDYAAFADFESAGTSLYDYVKPVFVRIEGPKDPASGGEIKNIAGVVKTGDYSMVITTTDFDATTIYSLGVTICPMHYYGDADQYNYENNQFGFPKGDLSLVAAKTTQPMGAGPYKFIRFEGGIVYYEANEFYYKGAPKITYLRFKETSDSLKVSGVVGGDTDITDPSISNTVVGQIKDANSNGELTGDVLSTSLVDNLGYGYIGINSVNVNVGGQQGSEASKNYRKALATMLAVYRDVVINSYYGDRAVVIQYPISNTSWAAPSPSDTGYEIAYSKDVDGNQIYNTSMTTEQKYAAAKQAAIGYLVAAGFTYDEATGKFTAAPEGASLSLTLDIPADGTGDHPAFAIFTYFEAAMEEMGFDIAIIDYAQTAPFWDKLEANNMQIWAAAWGASLDPDMYQVYHSSNGIGLGGTDSNHYNINDAQLDAKIMDARVSADNTYRKAVYKQCLDILLDWAVEIPTYQRKNCIIFSEQRVNMETMTPDITTFWLWYSDIETLEMNPVVE